MARPHTNVMRENTQTSSEGCHAWERVLRPVPSTWEHECHSSWGFCLRVVKVPVLLLGAVQPLPRECPEQLQT